MILDEIDKVGNTVHADPSYALLEVLDPEQNNSFLDHYLDVPYDLSHVFFIATANTVDSIPGPLLDRMEIIPLSGHTDQEKLSIAMEHLLPEQLEEHGIDGQTQLVILKESVLEIITSYTRESGVRDLKRKIAEICRVRDRKSVV